MPRWDQENAERRAAEIEAAQRQRLEAAERSAWTAAAQRRRESDSGDGAVGWDAASSSGGSRPQSRRREAEFEQSAPGLHRSNFGHGGQRLRRRGAAGRGTQSQVEGLLGGGGGGNSFNAELPPRPPPVRTVDSQRFANSRRHDEATVFGDGLSPGGAAKDSALVTQPQQSHQMAAQHLHGRYGRGVKMSHSVVAIGEDGAGPVAGFGRDERFTYGATNAGKNSKSLVFRHAAAPGTPPDAPPCGAEGSPKRARGESPEQATLFDGATFVSRNQDPTSSRRIVGGQPQRLFDHGGSTRTVGQDSLGPERRHFMGHADADGSERPPLDVGATRRHFPAAPSALGSNPPPPSPPRGRRQRLPDLDQAQEPSMRRRQFTTKPTVLFEEYDVPTATSSRRHFAPRRGELGQLG